MMMMLSPTPFSLLCALLLCLPLAIVFTITTPSTPLTATTSTTAATAVSCTSSAAAAAAAAANNHSSTVSTTTTTTGIRPLSALILPSAKTSQKPHQITTFSETLPSTTSSSSSIDSATVHNETVDYYDDEEDEALFRLAGRVNSSPDPPLGKKKKKVAFMFLTTSPLPFAPLWELFFSRAPKNLYNIYVHADPSSRYSPPFGGVFANQVIPSKPTRRHSPTLIAAARRLLSRALLHDKSNYMFALLSPSCIPLHSFNFTYKFLAKSRRSFIEILKDEPGAYDRWAARGEEAMLPEVKFTDFRIGSQFFVLKRKHARAVARDRRLWSKFKLPCLSASLGSCYPEEHYFPTLLSMVDPRGCVPAALTSVDWSGSYAGHPRMYHGAEVGPELIWDLRNRRPRYGDDRSNGSDSSATGIRRHDPYLFARKFSVDSLWPLMSIAEDVLFKD